MSAGAGLHRLMVGSAALLGAGFMSNGLFLLAAPAVWYVSVPGVTTTGPFNQHFLRDIGLIFLLVGGGFLWGAAKPALRAPFWGAGAVWLSGHALFHGWEVAVGICGPSALARDFPLVTLPAILTTLLALWAARDGGRAA